MWGEKRETEGEVGTREDGESLDENVGDGLILGKVRVELVAGVSMLARGNEDTRGQ